MSNADELGDFLRACRARLRPEQVGIVSTEHPGRRRSRRVPGLRREEVAGLAGVSVDYYTRLEQGRTGQVGQQVLDAIADALRLSDTERDYFLTLLAGPRAEAVPALPTVSRARPGMHQLLDAVGDLPAFVVGRGMQMLAMNRLARVVLFDLDQLPVLERNLARWTFLDPRAREVYVDWDSVAADTVAILRVDAAAEPNDRRLNELIGELSVKSEEFRLWWPEHQVYECTFGSKRLRHPLVGEFTIDYETFPVPGSPGQKLFVYTGAAATPAAEALNLLSSWTKSEYPTPPTTTRRPRADR